MRYDYDLRFCFDGLEPSDVVGWNVPFQPGGLGLGIPPVPLSVVQYVKVLTLLEGQVLVSAGVVVIQGNECLAVWMRRAGAARGRFARGGLSPGQPGGQSVVARPRCHRADTVMGGSLRRARQVLPAGILPADAARGRGARRCVEVSAGQDGLVGKVEVVGCKARVVARARALRVGRGQGLLAQAVAHPVAV